MRLVFFNTNTPEFTDCWPKILILFLAAASKQHYSDLERLQKDLFSNYSTNIIPQKEKTAAVNVTFDLALNQIIDLVSSTVLLNPVNLHTFACYGLVRSWRLSHVFGLDRCQLPLRSFLRRSKWALFQIWFSCISLKKHIVFISCLLL